MTGERGEDSIAGSVRYNAWGTIQAGQEEDTMITRRGEQRERSIQISRDDSDGEVRKKITNEINIKGSSLFRFSHGVKLTSGVDIGYLLTQRLLANHRRPNCKRRGLTATGVLMPQEFWFFPPISVYILHDTLS